MHYVIYCRDNPSTPTRRDEHYDEHRTYLKSTAIKIVLAGPWLDEKGKVKIGSMLVVDTESIEEAKAFQRNDPFARHAVWSEAFVNPYVINIDNRS
ncbi:YciI family protein [Pseudomonas syringae]|uniref:YciI-like protein n=1 Tax=Pseudomonas syringae pv. aceris TaxID=199198 RepID=A0A0P9GVD5_PSESX|nr:YciI family protein [Pseudomonas syringae]EGH71527.1 YciI-like protein [Pseudomonas syringae pv. aceris str. M302273]KPW09176.1 YciI-like protein [Pseudomonas syringae pv. aceris]